MVTGRGSSNERLRGSVLAIETQNKKGENVLLLRANNPQESLLHQIDAEELVRASLEEMKKLAERRGVQHLVVPLDAATQSSSNRTEVSNYYRREFGNAEKMELVDVNETNFNGYNNWKADGKHAVVKIN